MVQHRGFCHGLETPALCSSVGQLILRMNPLDKTHNKTERKAKIKMGRRREK
jgi:hypothetical protein